MARVFGAVLAVLVLSVMVIPVFAADIVTVPTANQLKRGQMDAAYYHIGLDMPAGAPQNVQVQTFYMGVTDKLELDIHRYDLDKSGDTTIINPSWLLMSETLVTPDLVVGGRNIGGSEVCGIPGSGKESWYVAAAKTLNLPTMGAPSLPIIRLHAGLGTKDPSLLGEDRHNGLFGGVQMLVTPQVGLVALHDSQDLITGITYTPRNTGLTLKGGTFGDHWWVGMSWAK